MSDAVSAVFVVAVCANQLVTMLSFFAGGLFAGMEGGRRMLSWTRRPSWLPPTLAFIIPPLSCAVISGMAIQAVQEAVC